MQSSTNNVTLGLSDLLNNLHLGGNTPTRRTRFGLNIQIWIQIHLQIKKQIQIQYKSNTKFAWKVEVGFTKNMLNIVILFSVMSHTYHIHHIHTHNTCTYHIHIYILETYFFHQWPSSGQGRCLAKGNQTKKTRSLMPKRPQSLRAMLSPWTKLWTS